MIRSFAIFALAVVVAGCDRTPSFSQAESGPMALLTSGSAKICTAPEVKRLLNDLIIPKVAAFGDYDLPAEDKVAAISGLGVKLSYATLEAFDKDVKKATCNATFVLQRSGGDLSNGDPVNYVISPSAEDEGDFVVTAAIAELRDTARSAVIATLQEQLQRRTSEAENVKLAAEQAELRQTVSSKWLIGRWISPQADSSACIDGPYVEFRRGGDYNAAGSAGHWSLTGTELAIEKQEGDGVDSFTSAITEADQNTFSEQREGAAASNMRRCSGADLRGEQAGSDDTY